MCLADYLIYGSGLVGTILCVYLLAVNDFDFEKTFFEKEDN